MSDDFDFGFGEDDLSPDTGVNMDEMDIPGFDDDSDIDFGLPEQTQQNVMQSTRTVQADQSVGDLSFDTDQQTVAKVNNKKIAIIAIAIGAAVILLCMLLFNLSSRAKQDGQNDADKQQEVYQESNNEAEHDNTPSQPDNNVDNYMDDNESSNNQNSNENQAVSPSTSDSNSSTSSNQGAANSEDDTTSDEWVQFELAGTLDFETTVDSEFTVTSIRHFAKVLNSQNDKIVKSIITGNIGGLVGTFDIELPYYKAVMLQPGTLLKVQYSCTIQNGTKVIGEIIFV